MKKTVTVLLAALAAAMLIATAACAENWERIAGTPDFKCYLDTDSVAMKNLDGAGYVTVKVKTTLTNAADSQLKAGKTYDTIIDEWVCDPFEKAFFIVKTEQFNGKKKIAKEKTKIDTAAFTSISKWSTAEVIYDQAMHIFKENRKAKKK